MPGVHCTLMEAPRLAQDVVDAELAAVRQWPSKSESSEFVRDELSTALASTHDHKHAVNVLHACLAA